MIIYFIILIVEKITNKSNIIILIQKNRFK